MESKKDHFEKQLMIKLLDIAKLNFTSKLSVLSAILFSCSRHNARPEMHANEYAFPGNKPNPLIACDLKTCPVQD